MKDLILIRRWIVVFVCIAIAAGVCNALQVAADGNFTPLGFVLVVVVVFWSVATLLSRRARTPIPPKYTDSDLQNRVRLALRSSDRAFVQEVTNDVAAQWGDNGTYFKLTTKLATLGGLRAVAAVAVDDRHLPNLGVLYPDVYGEGSEEDE